MCELSIRRALSACLLTGAVLIQVARAEDNPAAPVRLDNKEISAYLVIQDVKKVIDQIENLAKQSMPPGQFQPGMIAKQVGAALGDPTLATMSNKPFILMLFKIPAGYGPEQGPPPMAIFLPVTAANPMETAFQGKGVATAFNNGVLMVAPKPEFIDKAKAARADYDKIAAGKLPCDARLCVSIADLNDAFDPLIHAQLMTGQDAMLKSVAQGAAQIEKMGLKTDTLNQAVHLLFNAIGGFLNQADVMQLDATLKADGLTLDQTFAAKKGTLLAQMFSGTPPPANPNLKSFLKSGFIMTYANFDVKNQAAVFKKLLDIVAADPATAALTKNDFVSILSAPLEAVRGEMVSSIGQSAAGLTQTYAGTVENEAKYIAMMDSIFTMFGKDSMVSKLYASIGMTYEIVFEKNVRTHSGIAINRLTTKMEMPMLGKEQMEKMKKLIPNPESAIVKGYSLTSTNGAELDAMIDQVLKGDFSPPAASLKSEAVFGKNKNVYVDYDMIGYLKYTVSLMDPNGGAGGPFAQLKGGDPMVMAYSQGGGRARFQMQIPSAPVLQAIKTFQTMGQGMVPKAPPAEDGKF